MSKQDVFETTQEIQRIITDAQRTGWASATVRSELGSIKNYCDQIDSYVVPLLEPGPAPGPTPEPEPAPEPSRLRGVAVTYSTHGLARDCYLGLTEDEIAWGPHDGWPLIAPCDGTVTLYQFGTPLPALATRLARDPEYAAQHAALFDGWVCIAPPFVDAEQNLTWLAGAGQTMNVLVFVPVAPISTSYGLVRALWHGHVRNACQTGRMPKGDQFGLVGASGIQFERIGVSKARAAHSHACASATGQLSPNGDLDGMACAEAMEWDVTFLGNGPGPNEYMGGGICAGRELSDFEQGGHPIPRLAVA